MAFTSSELNLFEPEVYDSFFGVDLNISDLFYDSTYFLEETLLLETLKQEKDLRNLNPFSHTTFDSYHKFPLRYQNNFTSLNQPRLGRRDQRSNNPYYFSLYNNQRKRRNEVSKKISTNSPLQNQQYDLKNSHSVNQNNPNTKSIKNESENQNLKITLIHNNKNNKNNKKPKNQNKKNNHTKNNERGGFNTSVNENSHNTIKTKKKQNLQNVDLTLNIKDHKKNFSLSISKKRKKRQHPTNKEASTQNYKKKIKNHKPKENKKKFQNSKNPKELRKKDLPTKTEKVNENGNAKNKKQSHKKIHKRKSEKGHNKRKQKRAKKNNFEKYSLKTNKTSHKKSKYKLGSKSNKKKKTHKKHSHKNKHK
ncbi:hypothetical protein M0813_26276 [Anaeramoeba flamelloides]|uniref:Uncharacterized protein n=1 Tax=Anaeramoeba flamelloides TaxID=1746091 RepID=A0ABQ8Y0L6_9EUKA|nr:hypothetical protein M0813_26276 [Anaeramoeba flamelloides]